MTWGWVIVVDDAAIIGHFCTKVKLFIFSCTVDFSNVNDSILYFYVLLTYIIFEGDLMYFFNIND